MSIKWGSIVIYRNAVEVKTSHLAPTLPYTFQKKKTTPYAGLEKVPWDKKIFLMGKWLLTRKSLAQKARVQASYSLTKSLT